MKGLKHWEQHTCLRFLPANDTHLPHLQFRRLAGCRSGVGIEGTAGQNISIGDNCNRVRWGEGRRGQSYNRKKGRRKDGKRRKKGQENGRRDIFNKMREKSRQQRNVEEEEERGIFLTTLKKEREKERRRK